MCARPAEPGPLRSVQAEAAPARTVGKAASCGGPEGRGDRPRRLRRRRAKDHQSLPKQTAATARAATQRHDAPGGPPPGVRRRAFSEGRGQLRIPVPWPLRLRQVAPDPGARVRVTGMGARRRGCLVQVTHCLRAASAMAPGHATSSGQATVTSDSLPPVLHARLSHRVGGVAVGWAPERVGRSITVPERPSSDATSAPAAPGVATSAPGLAGD
jgi:hypothetical protein